MFQWSHINAGAGKAGINKFSIEKMWHFYSLSEEIIRTRKHLFHKVKLAISQNLLGTS